MPELSSNNYVINADGTWTTRAYSSGEHILQVGHGDGDTYSGGALTASVNGDPVTDILAITSGNVRKKIEIAVGEVVTLTLSGAGSPAITVALHKL